MADGRNFSSYDMAPALDKMVKKNANITTNTDYRRYLQTNADSIIKNNQLSACEECGTCLDLQKTVTQGSSPYIFSTILTTDQPYGYESSDLKNAYLSRQRLDALKHGPRFQI